MIGWWAKPHQKKSLKFQTTVFVTTHIHTKAFFRRGPSWADSNYSHAVWKRREKQQQRSSGTFNHILECCSRCTKMEAWGEPRRPEHCWGSSCPGIAAVIRSLDSDARTHAYTHTHAHTYTHRHTHVHAQHLCATYLAPDNLECTGCLHQCLGNLEWIISLDYLELFILNPLIRLFMKKKKKKQAVRFQTNNFLSSITWRTQRKSLFLMLTTVTFWN